MAGLTVPLSIGIPSGALVVLVGISGSGKTTFARRHFPWTHVLSSDEMRAIVADDPGDLSATDAAFELLHTALGLRLARRRTTVVDATNVEAWARARLLAIAARMRRPAVAIVLDLPMEACLERNRTRPDPRPVDALRRQQRRLRSSIETLASEGFAAVHRLESAEAVEGASLAIAP